MADAHLQNGKRGRVVTFPISEAERAREAALRAQFSEYWSTARGEPRAIFEAFIATTPLAEDVTVEGVREGPVLGFWVKPAGAAPGRALLFIHGGGYVQGSARAARGLASQVASRTHLSTFVLDYPLAPEAKLPSALTAVMEAYRWLGKNGASQIAVMGDSAGGGLALALLAALGQQPGERRAVAGVALSPWVDLAFTGPSMADPKVRDPLITRASLEDHARAYLGGADPRDPRASPLFGSFAGLPPLLVQVGSDEHLLDDARQYAERATRAGASVELEIWEGMHHVFQLNLAQLQSSQRALDNVARFLTRAFADTHA